jgi:hypothetical protein
MELDALPSDWYNPDWEDTGVVHDWKNYVDENIQLIWPTFNADQQQVLANHFQKQANAEEWS